jgi:hypothetical protein
MWIGAFFIFIANLFVLEALMGYPVYGFLIRTYLKPDILRKNEFVSLNYADFPNKIKSEFCATYQSGKGFYGIRQDTFCDFDGIPFTVYYLIDNGRLTRLVLDTPQNLFQIPRYSITDPNQVEPILGYRDENGRFIRCTSDETSHDLQIGFQKIKSTETFP